jgi:Heterokaryon incompatibility protein (HET)
MRLLNLNHDGSFSLAWFPKDKTPPYAILSHTWGRGEDDEVTYKDIIDGTGKKKKGFQKLQFCGNKAKAYDLHYFWVDTCCIDKSNEKELTTAINSMFRWYRNATRCYVYLSDVSMHSQDRQSRNVEWESEFRNSRWFTRGWTLQELLAPNIVEFFSCDCIRLGDKRSLEKQIHEITGIAVEALQGRLSEFSVDERFRWGEKRQTTEEEDKAYSLLGIFGVFMSLIYGEGEASAMTRLRREVAESGKSISQSLGEIIVECLVLIAD